MTRKAKPADIYSLVYDGVTSLDLSTGTYQLSYTAIKNGIVVSNPTLSYTVSDDTIAAASDTGLLTMIAAGNITVTAIWADGNNTTCKSAITIADTNNPNPPVSTGITAISGNTNLKDSYSRTYIARFYDLSDNEVTNIRVRVCPNCQNIIMEENRKLIDFQNFWEGSEPENSVPRICDYCGAPFWRNKQATKAIYCPECAEIIKLRKTRERVKITNKSNFS